MRPCRAPRCRSAASHRAAWSAASDGFSPTWVAARDAADPTSRGTAWRIADDGRLDGMMLNSMCGDGQVQFYQNTAIRRGDGLPDDGREMPMCQAPAISVNIIPKRGATCSTGPSSAWARIATWQSDNLTQDSESVATEGDRTRSITTTTSEGGQGGRLLQGQAVVLSARVCRRISGELTVADTPTRTAHRASTTQYLESAQLRLHVQSPAPIRSPRRRSRVSRW